jgi:hypothetical protein
VEMEVEVDDVLDMNPKDEARKGWSQLAVYTSCTPYYTGY